MWSARTGDSTTTTSWMQHFLDGICQDWRQLHHHFLNATFPWRDLPGKTASPQLPECNTAPWRDLPGLMTAPLLPVCKTFTWRDLPGLETTSLPLFECDTVPWRDLPGLETAPLPLPESKHFLNEICQDWRHRHYFLNAKHFLNGICQVSRRHYHHFLNAKDFLIEICQNLRHDQHSSYDEHLNESIYQSLIYST